MLNFINKLWYGDSPLSLLLWPFSLLYQAISELRRAYLQRFGQQQFPVPVIVIGNLTVGGVGKTPLVIAIAQRLKMKGLKVGIVSRGYKATIASFPHEVTPQDTAVTVGDEPLLLAKKTGCPVVIAPKRNEAIDYLLATHQSQIILSDDGLQHYAMGRDIEIVVVDGLRAFGNGLCLPAGPLREKVKRINRVNFLVVNQTSTTINTNWKQMKDVYSMTLEPGLFTAIKDGRELNAAALPRPIAAIAGIGHPQRFFNSLENLGLTIKQYAFSDHYAFQLKDLQLNEKTLVMTEKDAVKCQYFAQPHWYFLPVEAKLSDSFWDALWSHERLEGYI